MSKMKKKRPWENSATNDKTRILFHPLPNCRDRISKQSMDSAYQQMGKAG